MKKGKQCVILFLRLLAYQPATQAHQSFGFENVQRLTNRVKEAFEHAKYICEAIDQIARIDEDLL